MSDLWIVEEKYGDNWRPVDDSDVCHVTAGDAVRAAATLKNEDPETEYRVARYVRAIQ